MSHQISAKHSSRLTLNATRLQKLVVELDESSEESLSGGGDWSKLKRLQEEFGNQLSPNSSSSTGGPFFIILD